MRTCISCGDPIEGRRKDAKFCAKAACRAKDYRKRQAAPAAPAGSDHAHTAAAVLTCPCGRRYHLEITSLDHVATPTLEPAPVSAEPVTQTVSAATQPSTEASATSPAQVLLAENSSEQIAAAPSSPAAPAPVELEQTQPADALLPSTHGSITTAGFRTIELYFTDVTGRRYHLRDAMRRRAGGLWRVRDYARPALGIVPSEGAGLGGRPGRWQEFYGSRTPSDFGLDSDLAVLCWDDDDRRAYVPEVELLEEALGAGWRTKLRTRGNKSPST